VTKRTTFFLQICVTTTHGNCSAIDGSASDDDVFKMFRIFQNLQIYPESLLSFTSKSENQLFCMLLS